MRTEWHERDVPFKFMLGDKTLFKRDMRLLVREVGLSEQASPTAQPQVPAADLAPGSEGFFVRSLPVSVEQPTLRRRDGYLCYVPSQFQRYYIDLHLSFEEYRQKFSS